MKKPIPPTSASDEQICTLLVHYACPVPFHEVRTRFLGNIASPGVTVSPMKLVQELWGGELPEFQSLDAANELIGALIMGLWNQLSRHQERSAPFRLMRRAIEPGLIGGIAGGFSIPRRGLIRLRAAPPAY